MTIPPEKAGATSKLAINAPIMTETQDAMKMLEANHLPLVDFLVRSFIMKKLKPPIIAMLKRFMPKATIPPSEKKRACIPNTIVMLNIAVYGPNNIDRKVPPTRCPLVPKTIGKFIIRAANTKALDMARRAVIERV
jgi:hypothetical protein